MYKFYCIILLLFSCKISGQNTLKATVIDSFSLNAIKLHAIDLQDNLYYSSNNILYKKSNIDLQSYSNLALGDITSVNAFNPLKIIAFYKDFNTAIILDNRLAEMFKIDFSSLNSYKNISHIAPANNNSIWIFNQDEQLVELYDYKNKKVLKKTIPITSRVLNMISNYNYCWLLTEKYLYAFNYFGSIIFKLNNDGFTNLQEHHNNLILKKGNSLYLLANNGKSIQKMNLPNLLINQFFVTNQTLYIYSNETLYKYHLKFN